MLPSTQTRSIIALDKLKPAAHNPPGRVSPKNIAKLMDSIELVGLLHPLTVTRAHGIIDGHRRAAACTALGWTEVECNVIDHDPDEVYRSVNVSARKLSGNDALGVWLSNHNAVPTGMDEKIKKVEEQIGRVLLKRLYNSGLSTRVHTTAVRIGRYCDSMGEIKAIVEWLIEHATIGQVMKALDAGEDPRILMKAIRAKKPVRMRLMVEGAN